MYDLNWSEVEVLSDEQGTGGWHMYRTLFFGVLQELVCETSDWLPRLQKVTLMADDSFWEKKESKLWTRILSVDPPSLGRNYTTYVVEYGTITPALICVLWDRSGAMINGAPVSTS
jgi:hypothetical protein